jgi:hypothetical protein
VLIVKKKVTDRIAVCVCVAAIVTVKQTNITDVSAPGNVFIDMTDILNRWARNKFINVIFRIYYGQTVGIL